MVSGNPKLETLFSRGKGTVPKPIHITPLYVVKNSDERAYYCGKVAKGSAAKPPKLSELRPIRIEPNTPYRFYVGTSLELLDDVLLGLSNVGAFRFGNYLVYVSDITYEIKYVDLEREAEVIKKELIKSIYDKNVKMTLKVVFSSPTLLKDPLSLGRGRKRKSFLPLPESVFSTSFLMLLIESGKFKVSTYLRCMRYVKSVFDIPYTALKTVNIAWYVYNNKPLPALIGYVKYFIDPKVLDRANKITSVKYGIDLTDYISKSIILTKTYGIGDGRAAGFGHTKITIKSFPERRISYGGEFF